MTANFTAWAGINLAASYILNYGLVRYFLYIKQHVNLPGWRQINHFFYLLIWVASEFDCWGGGTRVQDGSKSMSASHDICPFFECAFIA